MTPNKKKLIGLTGNSGSGKTTLTKLLSENGYYIINSDKIAADIYKKGSPCYDELLDYFGYNILGNDSEIDRKKLGGIVFSDSEKLKILTKITHKYIYEEIFLEISKISRDSSSNRGIIVDAPVLVNTPQEKLFDEIWVVSADYETKLKRIIERDGIAEEYAKKRLESQPSQEELNRHAHLIIDNNERDNNNLKDYLLKLGIL